MSWFGFGGSSDAAPSSSVDAPSGALDLSGGMNFSVPGFETPAPAPEVDNSPFPSTPVLALDQIKHAGVPVTRQMSPYLQMDPSMFVSQQPQYIMPEGSVSGKGRLEFALGHIGWAVGGAFAVGCAKGGLGELMNPATRQLGGKPMITRIINATMKNGSGYAQPAGAAVFMYSVLEIALKNVRADDELNGLAAGAFTGAIYRSPHGLKASGTGALAGLVISLLWTLSSVDTRNRLKEAFDR